MTRLLEDLRRTRELVKSPNAWTQRVLARDAGGKVCDVTSSAAKSFDILGALTRAMATQQAYGLLARIAGGNLALWNDSKTREHSHVLALFDSAIDLATRQTPQEKEPLDD